MQTTQTFPIRIKIHFQFGMSNVFHEISMAIFITLEYHSLFQCKNISGKGINNINCKSVSLFALSFDECASAVWLHQRFFWFTPYVLDEFVCFFQSKMYVDSRRLLSDSFLSHDSCVNVILISSLEIKTKITSRFRRYILKQTKKWCDLQLEKMALKHFVVYLFQRNDLSILNTFSAAIYFVGATKIILSHYSRLRPLRCYSTK